VLLSEWHAAEHATRPFAWVSLERRDSDPVRFWSYLIASLQTVEPEVGASALAALPAAGPDLVDVVVTPLINERAASGRELVLVLVLVLDDYHLVHGGAIHESVASIVRHLPPGVQLAIASRADPPLSPARRRAAGELTEIRAADLAFSDAEAEALLNDSLALGLEARDVDRLQARTEGWAAGLQLAGLSLQAQADRHAFVEAFAGDDRHIGDYLHDMLAEQPPALRAFLLRTSILERMCAPLADAVTGGPERPSSWPRPNAPTSSSSRSTRGGSGSATTTFSPTCCGPSSSGWSASSCPSCTGARTPGTSSTASSRRRSGTRPEPASSGRPAS
jgi:LuxR family maltose regulon positive regulatory protein